MHLRVQRIVPCFGRQQLPPMPPLPFSNCVEERVCAIVKRRLSHTHRMREPLCRLLSRGAAAALASTADPIPDVIWERREKLSHQMRESAFIMKKSHLICSQNSRTRGFLGMRGRRRFVSFFLSSLLMLERSSRRVIPADPALPSFAPRHCCCLCSRPSQLPQSKRGPAVAAADVHSLLSRGRSGSRMGSWRERQQQVPTVCRNFANLHLCALSTLRSFSLACSLFTQLGIGESILGLQTLRLRSSCCRPC